MTNKIERAINQKVENMSVAEMRKVASQYGIKSASKFRRVELQAMLIEAMVAQAEAEEAAKKAQTKKQTGKRAKAEKVENESVETLAKELLEGIETIGDEDLMLVNRKVLIVVMKMLHCSKWYRTYDKATMIQKINEAKVAKVA